MLFVAALLIVTSAHAQVQYPKVNPGYEYQQENLRRELEIQRRSYEDQLRMNEQRRVFEQQREYERARQEMQNLRDEQELWRRRELPR